MSDKSASSHGSAGDISKCIQQLLIESDQQEKQMHKLNVLRNDFPILKKIKNTTTNSQKLQMFLRDAHFKNKIHEKLQQKGIHIEQGAPTLKIYLISTRFNTQVEQQFQQSDLLYVLHKFGHVSYIYTQQNIAFVLFQQQNSAYLAMKVLNQFHINQRTRLKARICTQEQNYWAYYVFNIRYQSAPNIYEIKAGTTPIKMISKFQFGTQNLAQFNISQRLIGPKGMYMKNIIEKMLASNPLAHKYNLNNIDEVFKMRVRGRGSGNHESDDKLHVFISSREKWMHERACIQIQGLIIKVLKDYKVAFQKKYKKYANGLAFKILTLENDGNYFNETKRVLFDDIEDLVDLVSLESEAKLSQKIIEQKIIARDQARNQGKYQMADQIRNWLKSKGVILVDSKFKRGKTTWNYIL